MPKQMTRKALLALLDGQAADALLDDDYMESEPDDVSVSELVMAYRRRETWSHARRDV